MTNNVELLIKGIGYIELDTQQSEEFGISLVYSIDDINKYGSRKSNYSKTIKIPGTKNNNILLGQLYDIRIDGSFDMTLKHDCVLMVNKNPIIDGFMVLNSIDKYLIGNKYQIFYEINIFDEVKNLLDDLAELKLSDLDFSSGFTLGSTTWGVGDHTFNENAVVESTYYGNLQYGAPTGFTYPYFYPVVNYGYSLYPYTSLGNYPYSGISLGVLYPSVFLKAIWDKIFYDNGYTYTSDFINGDTYDGLFTRLATIYNKKNKLTNTRYCQYNNSGQTFSRGYSDGHWEQINTYKKTSNYRGILQGGGPETNPNLWYELNKYYFDGTFNIFTDPAGGSIPYSIKGIKVPADGNYSVNIKLDITSDLADHDPSLYNLYLYNSEQDSEYNVNPLLLDSKDTNDIGGPGPEFPAVSIQYEYTVTDIDAKIDNVIFMLCWAGSKDPGPQPSTVEMYFASLELQENNQDEAFDDRYNKTLDLASTLPDMTQADFIREIIKLGNLYIKPSKINNKNLIIEPRDDFYDGSNVNWSDKVDYNKIINVKNLNDNNHNQITLTYTAGEDYYNKVYRNKYEEVYGTKTINSSNTLYNDSNSVDLKFQSYQMYNSTYLNTCLIPVLQKEVITTFYDAKEENQPMIGIITTDNFSTEIPFANYNSYYYTPPSPFVDYRWNNTFNIYDSGAWKPGIVSIQHTKEIAGKEYDLNFETNNPLHKTILQSPNNNLYTLFYKNQIDNIQHKNCRYVTMYLNLKLSDILELNFRSTVVIDGQMYLLQKIEYDATKQVSSKVELLKLVVPFNSGEPGSYDLMSIRYLPGDDDYYYTEDPDRIKIN